MKDSQQEGWWQRFQDSKYPAYVTLIHPNRFGVTTSKGQYPVSEVAVDDLLHGSADPDKWQPTTYTLKKGSCVLVLPEDATSAGKATVSQPWLVRVSGMCFEGDKDVAKPREKDEADVIEWEQQQLRQQRLSTVYFSLEVNYFYRLSDFPSGSLEPGKSNAKTFCKALVTLGIADTMQAAQKLIGSKGQETRAGRLLNRTVVFSTHVCRVTDDESEESGEDDEAEVPVPMESVMEACNVWFLGANQALPFLPAPVADKAEEATLQTVPKHKRAALAATMEALRQEHRELPPGYFCSLMYVKQTDQLVRLEDWASGKARTKAVGSWVQQSRQLAKQLLEQSQKQLANLQRQGQQGRQAAAAAAGPSSASAGDSDAAGDIDAAGDADDSLPTNPTELVGATARQQGAQASARPATPPQQQHSQQLAAGGRQQRRTPRKSGNPRMAVPQPEQRGRLRSAAAPAPAAAAAAAGSDSDVQIVSDDDDEQQEEEEEATPPAKKRRQAAAVVESPSSASSEESSEEDEEEEAGSEEGGSEDEQASGSSSGEEDASLGDQVVSSTSEEDEDSDEAAEKQVAAAAAAAGNKRGRGRPPGPSKAKSQAQPTAAAGGGKQQQHTPRAPSSGFKSSKGAVLSGRKKK